MNISLILIGSELLNGKIQDKNAQVLSRISFLHGLTLRHVFTIADVYEDFEPIMKIAQDQSDIIITSGGLGPTDDDLTMDFMSRFFNKPIKVSDDAIQVATGHYQRAGREFNKEKSKYRFLPLNFTPLTNPAGFAPGMYFFNENKHFISLPGVPREFESMVNEIVLTKFNQNNKLQKNIIIKTKGLPEEALFKTIAPNLWNDLAQLGSVSSLPHFLGVDIGVHISDSNPDILNVKEQQVMSIIKNSPIVQHIWHIGPESLEEVILAKAKAKNLKISFAESCTGGFNSHKLTQISGSSKVFYGGVVSYDNSVKENILKVKSETLAKFGAVSNEVAMEMAVGVNNVCKTDIAISTTGIAGPTGGSSQKPVGTVCIGFSDQLAIDAQTYHFTGDRETLKNRFSLMSLFVLLERINLHPGNN
jgi:nicotinamide-nucleotide amidase